MTPPDVRFAGLVAKGNANECWPFIGARNSDGYGGFRMKVNGNSKTISAHRAAWFFAYGRWPSQSILHRCDNPPCCNPAHLFEGTQSDNIADMVAKGRHRAPGLAWTDEHPLRLNPIRRAHGERHGHAKLTEADVRAIRREAAVGDRTQQQIANRYGVSRRLIGMIVRRAIWIYVEDDHAA